MKTVATFYSVKQHNHINPFWDGSINLRDGYFKTLGNKSKTICMVRY